MYIVYVSDGFITVLNNRIRVCFIVREDNPQVLARSMKGWSARIVVAAVLRFLVI